MLSFLYQITISPLYGLIEFFYKLFYEITDNEGVAVIGLSFVVTILTLPLYMAAEKWQEKERQTQKALKPGIDRIKSVFRGDEQYMILSVFYRQHRYHPVMALRSSFSLLIQIPFFIAAYSFLSNLEPLRGCSFLFIRDFGSPDAALRIGGGHTVNILPLAMTAINCVAGAIYSKGHNNSEKIQIYACAAVFLALLYNSPAGLVVYWTMNNVLSLVKNIFYKLRHPAKALYAVACAAGLGALLAAIFFMRGAKTEFRALLVATALVIPFVPALARLCGRLLASGFSALDGDPALRVSLFLIPAVTLALLAGLAVPSILIESEPEQYCYVDSYSSPAVFIITPLLQAAGLFVFWPSCFYALFSVKTKKAFAVLFSAALFLAAINCFAFSGEYGPILPELRFMQVQKFVPSGKTVLLNAAATAAALALLFLALKKAPAILQSACAVLLIAVSAVSVKNCVSIHRSYSRMARPEIRDTIDPVFHLANDTDGGRNVIVLMQDRCFLPLVPDVFDERPELKEKFDGFTFYPNTISFGVYTMIGTPGIFGGYDYTPYRMNERTDRTLQEKHNEAILSMPVLFSENGWNAAVADMPYENYLEQPVTDMYRDYPAVTRITTHGAYSDLWYRRHNMTKAPYLSTQIRRNFLYFSLFKMAPPGALRRFIYHDDYWLAYNPYDDSAKFIDNYSEIEFLPELTDTSSDRNSFLLLDNEATHEPILLQAPDYVPAETVTEYGSGNHAHDKMFHAMTGIFLRLADFFDYLKANGVYDNTRIIIVSDHGTSRDTGTMTNDGRLPFLKENVTATLLVKDFNARGAIKSDMTFMTNADTPDLATADLIQDAANPFTHSPFRVENKNDYVKIAVAPAESTRIRRNYRFNIADDQWFTVKDNIYADENWGRYTAAE